MRRWTGQSAKRFIGRRVAAIEEMVSLLGVSWTQVLFLTSLGLLYGALEGIGVSLLLPVLRYVEQGPVMFGRGDQPLICAVVTRLTTALSMPSALPVLLTLVFLAVLAKQAIRYVYRVYAGNVRFEAIARCRKAGFSAFVNANVPFALSEGHSRLVSALTTEIQLGADAVPFFLQMCESAILLGVYVLLLLFLAVWIVPLMLVAVATLGLAMRIRLKRSRAYGRDIAQANQVLHTAVAERLAGIRLLKMTGQEAQESGRLDWVVDAITRTSLKIARAKAAMEVAVDPLIILVAFIALYIAITSLGMTLASLGMVMFVLLRSVPVLRQFNDARQGVSVCMESLLRAQTVVDRARASSEIMSGTRGFTGLQREIVFDHVSFSYGLDSEDLVLREVSFRAPKGSLTAIVGRSGAGKSTLIDLIPRLQEASGGDITFDGISIKEFDVRSLRSAIGLIDQSGFLFDDMVASNISYGVHGATRADIIKAATAAYAHAFIEALPRGYDTVIGERGIRLSMGQRQRLALARVFLLNPAILLLDEPTNALDSESERYIQLALDRLREEKTSVIVAHRLSTIQRADQILVLEGGRIVERGDHATLLKAGDIYRELFGRQLLDVHAYA